ncbi:hypothetical protein [Citricoccus alkalitolerans]|uniref:ATP/GTP-binding protein n=1 Tax=Citricoccus alkalitolerans TaxID=246603 RepID=A0ABV8Y1V0_9MICC
MTDLQTLPDTLPGTALTLSKKDLARLKREDAKRQRAARQSRPRLTERWRQAREVSRHRPGPRGWSRAGGGPVDVIEAPFELQGTTVQVCGFYPFSAGAGLPVIGAPLGYHLRRRSLVCADPVSWFRAGVISNPSAFILGQPGLGKTSMVHRWITVLADWGVIPMVLADTRPDYVHTIRDLGGQVIRFSPGQGHINPMDLGPIVGRLTSIQDARERGKALEEMASRRRSLIAGVVGMMLGRELAPHERSVIATSLSDLDPELTTPPLLGEVIAHISARPQTLRAVTLTNDNDTEYDLRVREVLDALISLGPSGMYGTMFSEPTSEHIEVGRPAVFDISGVNENDHVLMAAVQSLCWNLGSATVSAEAYLAADEGRRRKTYLLVMDELWRILRASADMVHFIDSITRLNRGRMMAQVMVTHTMNDLKLAEPHLTATAWGFVERSAMVFLGGLAEGEMGNLREVFNLSRAEVSQLSDWIAEAPVDQWTGRAGLRPGAGNFLLKTGKEAGVPMHVQLTDLEIDNTNTNRDWDMVQ